MRPTATVLSYLCCVVFLTACGSGSGSGSDSQAMNLNGQRCSGPSGSGWCWQQPQPDGLATRDIIFYDINTGWLVGDFGLLMTSSDGGVHWSKQALATQSDLTMVRFATARHGWIAAAKAGEVWRTLDGGQNWARTEPTPLRSVSKMWALSDQILVITDNVGNKSAVTIDGGQTWRLTALVVDQVEADGTLWSFTGSSRSIDLGQTTESSLPAGWPPGAFAEQVGFGPQGSAWALLRLYDSASQSWRNLLARRTSAASSWSTIASAAPEADLGYELLTMNLDPNGDGLALAWPDPLPSGDIGPWQRFARTGDGGVHWQWLDLPTTEANPYVSSFNLVDTRTITVRLLQSTHSSLYLSTDAGQTWRTTLPQPGGPYDGSLVIKRDGGDQLLARAAETQWMRSTDEGLTWRDLPSRPANPAVVVALWIDGDGKGTAISGSTLLETQDSGLNWTVRRTNLPARDDVQLRVDGTGWMLSGGQLSRTADGGRTWVPQPTATAVTSTPVRILYAQGQVLRLEALAKCDNGSSTIDTCHTVLHASDDGGATWRVDATALRTVDGFITRPVAFASPQTVIRVDFFSAERSTDAGKTWSPIIVPGLQGNITRIQFQDAQRGWMLGLNGIALRTLDGGATWSLVTLPMPAARSGGTTVPALNAVAFADVNSGWMVGEEGLVLATRDGGSTWDLQPSGTPYALKSVFARDSGSVWVGGEGGAILASATGGRVAH